MSQGSWYVVGSLLGLLVVALLWVAGKPLGALGGYIELEERLRGGAAGWRVFFLVGVILGGLAFSLAGGGSMAPPSRGPEAARRAITSSEASSLAWAGASPARAQALPRVRTRSVASSSADRMSHGGGRFSAFPCFTD